MRVPLPREAVVRLGLLFCGRLLEFKRAGALRRSIGLCVLLDGLEVGASSRRALPGGLQWIVEVLLVREGAVLLQLRNEG